MVTFNEYSSFVKEAFISPVRSVMVIDDEYPTMDKLLSSQLEHYNPVDIERLRNVINVCRNPMNNWMLDVHDGDFTDKGIADHLHHSDLLILDYHLEGNGG